MVFWRIVGKHHDYLAPRIMGRRDYEVPQLVPFTQPEFVAHGSLSKQSRTVVGTIIVQLSPQLIGIRTVYGGPRRTHGCATSSQIA